MATPPPLQPELLAAGIVPAAVSVTCLGQVFAGEDERRAYFSARLREHLQDPALRATEGFPIGSDEDILALSDPPYYTACPNPYLAQIIAEWNVGRFAKSPYQREPFGATIIEVSLAALNQALVDACRARARRLSRAIWQIAPRAQRPICQIALQEDT